MKTRRLEWGFEREYRWLFVSNRLVPNRLVDVECLNSRRCCVVKVLYSFDVRWFSNTSSGFNVTWCRIRARSDPELLITSEVDIDGFVFAAVVSSLDINNIITNLTLTYQCTPYLSSLSQYNCERPGIDITKCMHNRSTYILKMHGKMIWDRINEYSDFIDNRYERKRRNEQMLICYSK